MAQGYVRISDLPQVAPLFPLSGVILLPRGQLPLNIFEPRYLNMVDDAMAGDRLIGLVQPMGGEMAHPELASVGCVGRITGFSETQDGRYLITLTGVCRFRILAELDGRAPYRQAQVDFAPFAHDLKAPEAEDDFDREPFLSALRDYLEGRGLEVDWDTARAAPPEALINSLSMALPFEPAEKQALIEAATLEDRERALTVLMRIDAADPGDSDLPSVQ